MIPAHGVAADHGQGATPMSQRCVRDDAQRPLAWFRMRTCFTSWSVSRPSTLVWRSSSPAGSAWPCPRAEATAPPAPSSGPNERASRPDPTVAIVKALFATCERIDARPTAFGVGIVAFVDGARRQGWTLEEIATALTELARELDER